MTVYAIIKEKNQDGKVLYDADGDFSMATAKLRKGSTLVKIVENKGAVKVGINQLVDLIVVASSVLKRKP